MSAAVVSTALAASVAPRAVWSARLDSRRPRLAAVARLASRGGLRWAAHFARVVLCAVESWQLAGRADAHDLATGARAATAAEASLAADVARLGAGRVCGRVDGPKAARALDRGREAVEAACDAFTMVADGAEADAAEALVCLAWGMDAHSIGGGWGGLDPAEDAEAARLLLSAIAGERQRRREAKARRQRDAAARAAVG